MGRFLLTLAQLWAYVALFTALALLVVWLWRRALDEAERDDRRR